jgi:putative ABC transport system permease protein
MDLLLLVRRNLLRDRPRTALTLLSIAGAVLLLAALLTVYNALHAAIRSPAARQILALRDRHAGDSGELPRAYADELRKIDGVDSVLPWSYVSVRVGTQAATVGMATDPDALPRIMRPIVSGIPAAQYEDFRRDHNAVLMGRDLMDRFHWKPGDTVTLEGSAVADFPVRIAGALDFPLLADNFLMHDAYYQALRGQGAAASIFFFHVTDPARVDEVRGEIARRFAAQPVATEVISIAQYVASVTARAGQASTFVLALVIVVSLATLLVAGNTMAMAARERSRDLAILRSIGFGRVRLLVLVLAEAVAIALLGGLLGGLGAYSVFHVVGLSIPLGPQSHFAIGGWTVLESLAVALTMGLVAGLPSALRAMRVDVLSVLRAVN